jgi:intracellular septation protein
MINSKKSPYFLLSFVPATGYWILETYFSLSVALVGGIILALLEMTIEKIFTKKLHTISKLNLFLILFLGGISLWAQEGIWFKLQPTFTGFSLFGFMCFFKLKKKSLMADMMKEINTELPFPEEVYLKLEWHLSLFLLFFALFMCYVAFNESTSTWIFWKTGGFYFAFFIFLIGEFFYMRKSVLRSRK